MNLPLDVQDASAVAAAVGGVDALAAPPLTKAC